jgi:hypothetical protein
MEYAHLTAQQRRKWRSDRIRAQYEKLTAVRENGVQKYHPEQVLVKVAMRWGLAPKTIDHIVSYRNGYQ